MHWNFRAKKNFPLVLLSGVFCALCLILSQPGISHQDLRQQASPASYIELSSQQIRPLLSGFGQASPEKFLNSLAEVSGKVVFRHPRLKKGELFNAGTVLLQIDDAEYQLRLAKAQSALTTAEVELAAHDTEISNQQLDVALSQHKLAIAQAEQARLAALRKQQNLSASALAQAQQAVLIQQQELQRLVNRQNLFPLQRKALLARQHQAKTDVQKAELDLARTVVRLPFSGRIAQVSVEKEQWVTAGMALFSAAGIEQVQIHAQFDYRQFQQFVGLFSDNPDFAQLSEQGIEAYFARQGVSARVSLLGDDSAVWQASIVRIQDELDPHSQTVGVVASISNSYQNMQRGKKPPLLTGMKVQLDLLGKASAFVAIPRHLLHNQQILLADETDQIQPYPLGSLLLQQQLALSTDLSLAGRKLLTTVQQPALPGQPLQLTLDQTTAAQVRHWIGAY